MRVLRRAGRVLTALSLGAIAGLAILLGCFWVGNHRTTVLPMPTGPFAVGRVTYDWRDPNQQELMAPSGGIPREVFAWVWYPAASQGSRPTADYFPKSWRDALSRQRGWFLTHFLWKDFARVQTHSVEDAEVAAAQSKYPVLLMRGGAAAEIAAYSSLAEDLASHGYVVVGFDAPYRSTLVVFPDGRVVARTPQNNADLVSGEQQTQLGNKLVQAWGADMSFALDQMEALDASDATGRFTGRLDLTRVGVFGHSLGGATTMQFCHDDARCKAGVDIDGAPLGSVVPEGMKQPLLFVESDHHRESKAETDSVEADVRSIYRRLPEDKRLWVVIRGAGHYGFADLAPAPVQVMHWVRIFPVDGERQIVMTRDYLRRFFDVWLKGAPASALQSVQKYPEIEAGH